ncbi:RND efflux system, outer membrane lipoprotein, NodT family [Candidatus Sulfopaludibacter sp. SbA3]|nr:RND efflux system, outer membrane lipoprotein, NodT family [Candidatus Sulfopaludibacter sp. SbA3]
MRTSTVLAGCALLLMGCTAGPKYARPVVPAAPAFSEQPPQSFLESQGWKQAQPADSTLRADWWQLFGNSGLNRLEEEIDLSNQTLKAAEARFREARALIQLNRAGLYPTVSAAPSVTTNRVSQNAPLGTHAGDFGQYTLPIDVNYELDAWGRVHRSIAAAREETQASAGDLETIRLSLHTELAIDYFELLSLDAQKQLLDETMAAYQKALELTQNRFDGGLSSRAEVAQARTQLETTRAQDIGVGVARATFQHAIAILTGHTPESLSLAAAPLNSSPPVIPVGVPSQLLERRPDIAAAERRAAEANEQIGIARAAFFPTLLLTATGGFEGNNPVNWLSWPSRLWAVGPAVAETIFDAGRRRAASESAVAAYDESVANYRQAVLEAFQQVEDNLATLRVLEQQARAQRVAVEAAQQSLNLALNRYKGGLVTYLEVVTAQSIALENQSAEVDILRRRMDASVLLIKALGGGWDTAKLPRT